MIAEISDRESDEESDSSDTLVRIKNDHRYVVGTVSPHRYLGQAVGNGLCRYYLPGSSIPSAAVQNPASQFTDLLV
ncbi:hypothetical protein E3N88_09510 [Mikania micrantha]|uniref:Uncharacterized protein n=1 Tax=Mikania micrantha TaxID=192012 RepID=A0A5N6PJB6_9ASTR|nr:hypothetical protein E3N88_09510 [Mikania micrantha]